MRKALVAIGLLAATGLTGCDWWNKPAPQPVAVTCQCAPPIRGTLAPAAVQRETGRASHRYAAHRDRRYERYAESSADIYGYSSESHSYGEGYGGGGTYGESEERFRDSARVWEDGYGRRHLYDAGEAGYYADQSHRRFAETQARLDPWHGYDDDWE